MTRQDVTPSRQSGLLPADIGHIDPDALDRLFDAARSSDLVISFTYEDWAVRVQHDAVTVVDGADTASAEPESTA